MKPILFFLLLIGLQACISSQALEDQLGHYYSWKWDMHQKGTAKQANSFENDSVAFQFQPQSTQIDFSLKNKTSDSLSLLWDSSFFYQDKLVSPLGLSIFGDKTYKKYAKIVIAPQQTIEGHLYPIYLMNERNDSLRGVFTWAKKEIYPTNDYNSNKNSIVIMGALGKDIFALTFLTQQQQAKREYIFTFYPKEIERNLHQ